MILPAVGSFQKSAGVLKGSFQNKGYGFIEYKENEDVFIHYSTIQTDGYKTLTEGQYVEFELISTPKGFQALNVCPIKEPATTK